MRTALSPALAETDQGDAIDCLDDPYIDRIWRDLSETFSAEKCERFVDQSVKLDQLPDAVERILQGGVCGRTLVQPTEDPA